MTADTNLAQMPKLSELDGVCYPDTSTFSEGLYLLWVNVGERAAVVPVLKSGTTGRWYDWRGDKLLGEGPSYPGTVAYAEGPFPERLVDDVL